MEQEFRPNTDNSAAPWRSMGLSSRLSCIMNLFPRNLWGYIITEPIFSSEEIYEIDEYFGYPPSFHNLHPRAYWDRRPDTQAPAYHHAPAPAPARSGVANNVVTHYHVHFVAQDHYHPPPWEEQPIAVQPETPPTTGTREREVKKEPVAEESTGNHAISTTNNDNDLDTDSSSKRVKVEQVSDADA